MPDIRIKVGKRIRLLREQASMTPKDLAYASDLDRSYIASVENGKRNISIVNLEKIAKALNTTLSNLFKDL